MSFEELMVEHIKALRENTKAIREYTKAVAAETNPEINVEHTANSACSFCGIGFKTLKSHVANGLITPVRKKDGTREYFKEKDLVALCETKNLYSGEYGSMKKNPQSQYYEEWV